MEKIIIKTRKENANDEERRTCPECGNVTIFVWDNLKEYTRKGLFNVEVKVYDTYKCNDCGCEWKIYRQ